MNNKKNPILKADPSKGTRSIIIVGLALCVGGCCCLLMIAGVFLIRSGWNTNIVMPASQTPPQVSSQPTATISIDTVAILDYEAEPRFGSVSLQRAFSPDPFTVTVEAGGTVHTAGLHLDCGFTTSSPTFTFKLSGGASEGFLRIFYAAKDGTDTTLVIHTPDQKWVCMDNSSYGNKIDPVIDIEYAASGEYAIWVGTHQSGSYGTGTLSITQSATTTP
jgi:hypothetical protein